MSTEIISLQGIAVYIRRFEGMCWQRALGIGSGIHTYFQSDECREFLNATGHAVT